MRWPPAFGACALLMLAFGAAAAHAQADAEQPTRQQLIGTWRLLRIEYSERRGARVDPFYQAGSTGLLIYDASGWMSVFITAPDRRRFEVPGSRLGADRNPQRMRLKTDAFDSFYAYDGRWELDAPKSQILHHVVDSLLAAEQGRTYAQHVSLEDGRLVFSDRSGAPGAERLRRKIWERVQDAR